MKLYFKELYCYQNIPLKDKKSDFYKPDNFFDLALLPNQNMQDDLAPFIVSRGQELTFKSLYVDWRHYLLLSEFLSTYYRDTDSLLSLDMDEVIPNMEHWLEEKDISPLVKHGDGFIYHASIRYLQRAIEYLTPKDYIFFSDLECFKDVPKEKRNSKKYTPASYFDLGKLPEKLIPEMKEYILYRGSTLNFSSIETERMAYVYVSDFLSTSYSALESLSNLDRDKSQRKLRAYLLKNGLPLTYSHKKRDTGTEEIRNHPSIDYLNHVLEYFTEDDGLFHFEDDKWYFDRLDFPVKQSAIHPTKSICFDGISQEEMKKEIKNASLLRLRQVAVPTVRANIGVLKVFCSFLEQQYPQLLSLTEVDREIIESYILYLNTEDTRKNNYHTELINLKAAFTALAMVTDELSLMNLFLADDIPRKNIPVYTFYTDNELRTLNRGFKTLEPQYGRAIILHEILGCRICETLTLKTDCIRQDDNGTFYIHINQTKVNRSYKKPINNDIIALIKASIAYNKEHYGDCEYVFVNDSNPTQPMQYGSLMYRLKCMVLENDLRNDNGELFKIGTHIFRKTYGRRLCDMGLDDSIIAKLLGHSGTSSVKHYRRMTSSVLAEGTKPLREAKDEMINKYKGGWN